MIIYIDENMSPFLAKGFNILQEPLNLKLREPIDVRSIKQDFGSGALDEEWIPLAGQKGSCIITQDYNLKRIKHQKVNLKKLNNLLYCEHLFCNRFFRK
jgi:uncharacterized protein YacL